MRRAHASAPPIYPVRQTQGQRFSCGKGGGTLLLSFAASDHVVLGHLMSKDAAMPHGPLSCGGHQGAGKSSISGPRCPNLATQMTRKVIQFGCHVALICNTIEDLIRLPTKAPTGPLRRLTRACVCRQALQYSGRGLGSFE
jgi:hypothetical protein